MRQKPRLFFLLWMLLIAALTFLYAGDKGKIIKMNGREFTNSKISTKADLIHKLNNEPEYANLSASQKVKAITEILQREKRTLLGPYKSKKSDRMQDKNSGELKMKMY